MRRLAQLALAVALVAGACSDDVGETTTSSVTTSATTTSVTTTTPVIPPSVPTTTTTGAGPLCPAPVVVTTTAEMVAALDGFEWLIEAPYASGNLPITPDLVVQGTVTLTSGDIAIPDWCNGEDGCGPSVAFVWPGDLDGLTAEGEQATADASLTFTDTTIRLRPYVMDQHPLQITWAPILSVRPPCGLTCTEGQTMCPLDGACYSTDTFCTRCEERTPAECACRDLNGPRAEGSICPLFISNDQIVTGVCRSGVCDTG